MVWSQYVYEATVGLDAEDDTGTDDAAAPVATPTVAAVAARHRAPSHRVGVVAARCAPSASPPETEKAAVAYFGCG